MFNDHWFWADRYGWPPDVVDRQSTVVMYRLREVTLEVERWRNEQAERDG